MARHFFAPAGLTGGTSGKLDYIWPEDDLVSGESVPETGDQVVCLDSDELYWHVYDGTNDNTANPEDSPEIIVPDSNSTGYGAWLKKAHVGAQAEYLKARSSDPDDPPNGKSVMWVSDGTGSGDAGDVMMKVTVSGVTKTITIFDYSVV